MPNIPCSQNLTLDKSSKNTEFKKKTILISNSTLDDFLMIPLTVLYSNRFEYIVPLLRPQVGSEPKTNIFQQNQILINATTPNKNFISLDLCGKGLLSNYMHTEKTSQNRYPKKG